MSDVTLGDLRASLEAERTALAHQLAELGFGDEGSLTFDANFADSSQVTAERGEAEALAGQLRETLREVEAALEKIERGEYGNCESCSEEIGSARLEAMPAARYCITCASRR